MEFAQSIQFRYLSSAQIDTEFYVKPLISVLYLKYPNCQTLSSKLSWSHYCELLYISDDDKRNFYEKEAINANWSVRELKRQISTSLFERLLLSNGDANKKKVLELAL